MSLRPTLFFAGDAEQAITHYAAALGGHAEITRFAGSPAADGMPAEWGQKVLYGIVRTPHGDVSLMDAPPGREGTPGGNFAIAIDVDNEERAANIFAQLAEGGTVMMPFETTFFARKFGMTNDKFGVRWMVSVPAPEPAAAR